MLLTDNHQALASLHLHTPVLTKFDQRLALLAERSEEPGAYAPCDPDRDWPLFDAASGNEVRYLLKALVDGGELVKAVAEESWLLTTRGWERALRQQNAPPPGTCFIAMAFHSDLNAAYAEGIEPAVKECGLRVVRIDKVEHNGIVNDAMLAEIRGCQVLVADVTLQRNGVYFEAGFALGLGRIVIWCCRQEDLPNVHFDTRQYSHVVWNEPADLREKLAARLRATVQIPAVPRGGQ